MSDLERAVRVICRPEIAAGFELAGIVPELAHDADQAGETLERLAADADTGVVLIEERLHDSIPASILAPITRASLPIVVCFPGPSYAGRATPTEAVVELLRRVVGYRVQPR